MSGESGSGDTPRKTTRGRRALYRHPRWEEIELRLRLRWDSERVVRWFQTQYPGEPVPHVRSLQRIVKGKPPGWFATALTVAETMQPDLPRLLVLQEQVQLIEVLKGRIRLGMGKEEAVGGFLLPEVRANLELLSRVLESHFKIQQELGLEAHLKPGEGPLPGSPLIGALQVNVEEVRLQMMPEDQRVSRILQLLGIVLGTDLPPRSVPERHGEADGDSG